MSFVNAVMMARPTLSNVPAAEESALGSTQNFEQSIALTNVSINDNNNDEFSEGGSNERQVKKNVGTKRQINFREEALHLEKRKMKLMEERMMKKSQADEDEEYMFLMSLHITYNKQTEKRKFLCRYKSGQTCWIKCSDTCLRCIPRQKLVCCVAAVLATM